jgi:site-specific recombinase XerD
MSESEKPKKFLDLVKERCRYRHFSLRTEQSYSGWIKRFILYHDKRHPREMGAVEVTAFLSYLVNEQGVSGSTHQQALSALLFPYKEVLACELPWLDETNYPN